MQLGDVVSVAELITRRGVNDGAADLLIALEHRAQLRVEVWRAKQLRGQLRPQFTVAHPRLRRHLRQIPCHPRAQVVELRDAAEHALARRQLREEHGLLQRRLLVQLELQQRLGAPAFRHPPHARCDVDGGRGGAGPPPGGHGLADRRAGLASVADAVGGDGCGERLGSRRLRRTRLEERRRGRPCDEYMWQIGWRSLELEHRALVGDGVLEEGRGNRRELHVPHLWTTARRQKDGSEDSTSSAAWWRAAARARPCEWPQVAWEACHGVRAPPARAPRSAAMSRAL